MLRPHAQAAEGAVAEPLMMEVVAGPRAGARLRIDPGASLSVGHDYDSDVVLRHASVRGVRVRLSSGADGVSITVEAGTAGLSGLPLEAGRTVKLPRWTPLSIGDARLVIGPDDAKAWRSCRLLLRRSDRAASARAATVASGPDAAADAAGRRLSPGAGLGRRRGVRVALACAVSVAALVGLAASLPAQAPRASADHVPAADALRGFLAAQGFGQLVVQSGSTGVPVIAGFVDRDVDRARLAAALKEAGLSAALDLASGEQLARQVDDVMRLHGVPAQARHLGRGVVGVRLLAERTDRLADAERAVRRDVVGLADLTVEAAPAAARPAVPVPPAAADPGKRVVTVVYGPDGYVVTVDGARYFEGAVLPSGHRISRISQTDVQLERDGSVSRLSL